MGTANQITANQITLFRVLFLSANAMKLDLDQFKTVYDKITQRTQYEREVNRDAFHNRF